MKENFMIDDAEIASFSLNDMITGFDEDTSAYTHLPAKNPYPHFCFALNIGMTVEITCQSWNGANAERWSA